ncbi:dTDP-glucose 4,6-dehydratase [Candidatus Gottesmanbacteria bacterium]|nr:dTDP-glucose 4,6-dehydratase [Candidatus Gottesmanbacteria bacterium]
MKLLITGGAGFIGSNFIMYWLKKYPEDIIINLDKLTYAGNLDNLITVSQNSNYRLVKGDICDKKIVDQILKDGIDIVVNFAAESHVDRSLSHSSEFIQTNIVGTHVLLESVLHYKVKRFHHISTDEVFGSLALDDAAKFSENSSYHPNSPYSASKAAADHLVGSYYSSYNLPMTITNCSNNYGPYQHPEKLIPLCITNILEGKKVPVYGDGKNIRDWLFVEDHCLAIDLVIKNGKIGQTYCIGGMTKDISNLEIVRKIIQILKVDEEVIQYVVDRPGHDRKYAVDWTKIKSNLGWQPVKDFDEWLEFTVDWYLKNTSWWKKLKGEEFQKYYQSQYSDL